MPRSRRSGTPASIMRLRRRLAREGGRAPCGICTRIIEMGLPATWEIDHIVPRSHGGSDDPSNLRVVCKTCNRQRGAGRQAARTQTDRSASW